MRLREADPETMRSGRSGQVDVVWRLRRSPIAKAALLGVAKVCTGMLAVVAIFTILFVWAFGHALAWSIIGCLFAALPLTGLILNIGVGLRAAVAVGPRRIAIRFLGRWRGVDLGDVRAVRLADQGPFGGFGGYGGSGGYGRFGGFGGSGPRGFGGGGAGGRTLVFEDARGGRVQIGVDALDAGLAEVVRDGLAPDADIDPDAARALGSGPESGHVLERGSGGDVIDVSGRVSDRDSTTGDAQTRTPEQETGHRP